MDLPMEPSEICRQWWQFARDPHAVGKVHVDKGWDMTNRDAT